MARNFMGFLSIWRRLYDAARVSSGMASMGLGEAAQPVGTGADGGVGGHNDKRYAIRFTFWVGHIRDNAMRCGLGGWGD